VSQAYPHGHDSSSRSLVNRTLASAGLPGDVLRDTESKHAPEVIQGRISETLY